MKINKNNYSLCAFKSDFLCVLQPNISQFFSFIDMLAGYPFLSLWNCAENWELHSRTQTNTFE